MPNFSCLTSTILLLGILCTSATAFQSSSATESSASDPSYLAHIAAANSALRLHETTEAKRWLAATPGQKNSWEWRHLNAVADSSILKAETGSWSPVRLQYSPNGETIAVAGDDGKVRLMDSADLKIKSEWQAGTKAIYSARFSPDASQMATCSRDGEIALWKTDDGELIWKAKSGGEGLADISFHPNGKQILFSSWYRGSGSVVGLVSLWDVESGEQTWKTDFGVKPIVAARFSHDGKRFAVGTWDSLVGVWDSESLDEPKVFDFSDQPTYSAIDDIAFSHDDQFIAAATKNGSPRIWSLNDDAKPVDLHGHNNAVFSIAFTKDANVLITAGSDGVACLWHLNSREILHKFMGHENRISSLAAHPNGKQFATASADKTIRLWHLQDAKGYVSPNQSKYPYGMTVSHDGAYLATGGQVDARVTFWDTNTKEELRSSSVIDGSINYLDFGPDALVAGGNWEGDVVVWSALTGEEVKRMKKANQGGLQQCSFSPNGKWIAATTKKNQVAIWDVATTELIKLIPLDGGCWGIDFSSDSQWLAVGDVTGKIHVFEAGQFSPSWSCAGNEASILGLKFGKDASVILAGSENGKICCYDATTHQLRWSANGHSQRIWSVTVSSDGSRLATGSADQKVRLWDVASGNPVLTTAVLPDVVYSVEFSSDDKLFINTLGIRIHSLSAGVNP